MSANAGSLRPTYEGHVATCHDALVLFEACLQGQLSHVPRRPHDRERSQLIKSGSVFIYEENASGIKRWTDGVPWSPSRILGNFLVYRELEKPFPPGEKKRATKRTARRQPRPGEPYARTSTESASHDSSMYSPGTPATPTYAQQNQDGGLDKETERSLIGSLVDSYQFKDGGLVKKTMSVNVNGVHHHLVSYYKMEDVLAKKWPAPSEHTQLQHIRPRNELLKQNFRAPLDDSGDLSELDPASRIYQSYVVSYAHAQPDAYYPPMHNNPSYAPSSRPQAHMQNPSSYNPSPTMPVPNYYAQSMTPSQPQRDSYGSYTSTTFPPRYDGLAAPISSSLTPTTSLTATDRGGSSQGFVPQQMPQPVSYPQHSVNAMRSGTYEPSRWSTQGVAASSHANLPTSGQYPTAPHLQQPQLQSSPMASGWSSNHHG
ncbi:MAG: hypothetical protein M1834_000339 [Cirrosporium novae-zelandiae]|nr:MAG: hypothetical protein M1834_000339 [Cirrosporium novae-zelandiae]